MDINLDSLSPTNIYLRGTPIRAYYFTRIQVEDDLSPDPDDVLRRLQNYRPVHYPYVWHLRGDRAAIVNFDDINEYYNSQQSPSSSTTTNGEPQTMSIRYIYEDSDEVSSIQEAINESFEQAASYVPCNGLTKKLISKNLRVTKYCEEEEEECEICVVCQMEFESNERVAVLQCKHRYHPRCITQWLVQQNVCPICKGQGLSV